MPKMPAFCDSCGTIFPSGFSDENTHSIFFNCEAGPCPNCGGMGHIPDGFFYFIGNTIELLQGPDRTIEELKSLAKVLEKAHSSKLTQEQVASAISTEVPTLSFISNYLPKNAAELCAYINILLATITILFNVMTHEPKQKVQPEQVINHIYQQNIQNTNNYHMPAASNTSYTGGKVGRNEKCPCGSGLKFKKCCGKNL